MLVQPNLGLDDVTQQRQAETFRLQVLSDYRVEGSPHEQPFDDIAQYAKDLCNVPIGLISIVGDERVYCKAHAGLTLYDYARAGSFCDAAIRTPDVFTVPDALHDQRFIANAYVQGPPNIRFYAAAPLVTSESAIIGTVCVIDSVPRQINDAQSKGLHMLARQTVTQLELRRRDLERDFLKRAGDALGARLSGHGDLAQGAALAVSFLADVCAIDLVHRDGTWHRAHVAHAQPQDAGLAAHLQRLGQHQDTFTIARQVLATQRSFMLRPDMQHPQDTPGVDNIMVVPLTSRDQGLGVLTLFGHLPRLPFDQAQLGLAEAFARLLALALDNTRLFDNAQRAVAVRDEFIALAAHELRTPLTALNVQSDSLLRSCDQEDAKLVGAARRKLPRLRAQLDRLQTLVDELVSVSQIQTAPFVVDPEPVDLVALVQALVQRFAEPAAQIGSFISVQAPDTPAWVQDAAHVTQVVEHLLLNGLRYGLGKPIEVTVRALPDDGAVEVTLTDHGLGIAAEQQACIFERFMRLNAMQNYGGLGLGLWLVREVVHALGGSIAVRSAVGEGSCFILRLPCVESRGKALPPT